MTKKEQLLKHQIEHCKKCNLSLYRKHAVPGIGMAKKKIMIIGEAPGKTEDQKAKPFVGRSGRFFTNALAEGFGLEAEDFFLTNIVKCHPPKNRTPKAKEILSCHHYLLEELALKKPKLILALGKTATLACFRHWDLSTKNFSMKKVQGKAYPVDRGKILLISFFHPAYFLYQPAQKKNWDKNLLFLKKIIKKNKTQIT